MRAAGSKPQMITRRRLSCQLLGAGQGRPLFASQHSHQHQLLLLLLDNNNRPFDICCPFSRQYSYSSSASMARPGSDAALLDTTRDARTRIAGSASVLQNHHYQSYSSSSSSSSSSPPPDSSGASLWWNKRATTTTATMTTWYTTPSTSFTRWEDEAWLKRARDIWQSSNNNNNNNNAPAAAESSLTASNDDDDDVEKIEALLARIDEVRYQPLSDMEQVDLLQRLCRQQRARATATTAAAAAAALTTDFMNSTLERILFRPQAAATAAARQHQYHHQQAEPVEAEPAAEQVLTLDRLRQVLEETCWNNQPTGGGCWQPNHDTFRLYIRIATDVFQDARAAQEILQRQWQYYYRALGADAADDDGTITRSSSSSSSSDDDSDDAHDTDGTHRRWLHLIRPNRYTYTCVIQAWSRQAAAAAAAVAATTSNNNKGNEHEDNHLVPHQEIEKLIRELQDHYQQDCCTMVTRDNTATMTALTPSASSSSSFKPTEATYIGWITASSCMVDEETAMQKVLDILKELIHNAQRDDFWPSTAIYNAVLFCILHGNSNSQNSSSYHRYGTAKRQRNVALHRLQTAEALVEEMCQSYMNGTNRYCMPDTATFSTIMSAWNKTTTTIAPSPSQARVVDDEFAPEIKAERLLNLLIDLYRQTGHESLRPNEYVWGCVINAWAKSSTPWAPQRAEEILYRMIDMHNEHAQRQQGYKPPNLDTGDPLMLPLPNTVIFNSVLNAWARSSAVDAPERLEAIWRSMVAGTDKNRDDFQQQRRRMQIRPDTLSYMARISVWERSHRTNQEMITKCREILNEMLLYDASHNHCLSSKQQGSDIPMVKHYNRVLLAMARGGRADEAEELVREMQSADAKPNKIVVQPNLITYNFLLLAWSKSKSPHAPLRAEAILREMMIQQKRQQRHPARITIHPDHVSLNTALTCWARSNHPQAPESAWHLYQAVKNKCHVKPDTFTFGIMLQAVARSKAHTPFQKATMARQLQQEMAKEGIKADEHVEMFVGKCLKGTHAKQHANPPSGSIPPMDEIGVK